MDSNRRPNSEVFIDLFTEIEQKLKDICGDTYHSNFGDLLRRAKSLNPVVQQFYFDLREYSQLRNAITHNRRENFIIAEPHEEVIKEIRKIRNLLYNPPKVSSIIKAKPYFATPETPMIELMNTFASKGFMRCPVIVNGKIHCMITAKTIAKWITSNFNNLDEKKNTNLEPLISFAEFDDFAIVGENSDLVSLVGLFKNSIRNGKYLQAVVVTVNGQPNSPLVGIITPSDLPTIMEKID